MACVVLEAYPPDEPPPKLDQSWTRFVCISDTHSRRFSIPPGDILLHAGDLSSWGSFKQLKKTIDWLMTLPHEIKIIIAGNHDLCLDSKWKRTNKAGGLDPEEIDAALEFMQSEQVKGSGIIYLDRTSAEVVTSRGVKWMVYGSPAAPKYVEGAFQYESKAGAQAEWAQIPNNAEILLSHTPPYGLLDETRRGSRAGCRVLSAKVATMEKCRLHVFGHIHEAFGAQVTEIDQGNGTSRNLVNVNAAIANGCQPIIVDLQKEL